MALWEAAVGYFFVTLFFFLDKEIVEIFMESPNSNHLERGPSFLLSCMYHLLLFWKLSFGNFDIFF